MNKELKVSIVRGGTSKGIFIMEEELPKEQTLRDEIILRIFGSPDIRQIDGLGGADVLTSKLAIIGKSKNKMADIDYTFGQVSIDRPFIDYGGNCGNISSAVGGFAIDHGLVKALEPITEVKIQMTNTKRILKAYIPVKNGKAAVEGEYKIDGVPGTGARIIMDWSDAAGGITGKLLPTSNEKDMIQAGERNYTVSVVDAGNITVFINANDLGLTGTESPAKLESESNIMDIAEEIRGKVCVKLGLVSNWRDAKHVTPYQPFFAIISPPKHYMGLNQAEVQKENVDIVSRIIFMGHLHKAYPISGTVATGAAARIPGSLVHDLMSPKTQAEITLRIGHPSGIIAINAAGVTNALHQTRMTRLEVSRTARTIMNGIVYISPNNNK